MPRTSKRTGEKQRVARASKPVAEWRMYWLAYNVALESDVVELIEEQKITAYTRWDDVKGRGHSGPHFNDEVWPAVNALYLFAAPAAMEPGLTAAIGKLRAKYPGEGVKLIVQPCLGVY
jgi:hypothetical protein